MTELDKKESDLQILSDDLLCKASNIKKIMIDLKKKEDIVSSKFKLLSLREKSLDMREIKLEQREEALKSSMNFR